VFLVLYFVGLAFFAYKTNWTALVLWLVFLPCLKWAYLRFFPRISKLKGYGSIEDRQPSSFEKSRADVTYYFLVGCPFCPIVKRRLEALQREMGFRLTAIDLTLSPQVAASKGIRSVPVVEVGKDRLIGNATTEQLAQLIAGAKISSIANNHLNGYG
jgi:glutaredoxin